MARIRQLCLLMALLGPLHMLEQLMFGIDELYTLRRGLVVYHSWFANPDQGTVLLVTIAMAALLFLSYGLVAGGSLRLASSAVFGLLGVSEVHHMAQAFVSASYNPGVVTAVPFVAVGVMLLVAVNAEYRRQRISWANVEPAYQTW